MTFNQVMDKARFLSSGCSTMARTQRYLPQPENKRKGGECTLTHLHSDLEGQ